MSYRSIKTVLGETSLERKCRLLFGASLFVLIAASFWWYGRQTAEIVTEQNCSDRARLLIDGMLMSKHCAWWEKDNKVAARVIEDLTRELAKQSYTVQFILPRGEGPNGPRDAFEVAARDRFLKGRPPQAKELDIPEFAERWRPEAKQYQYYQPIRADAGSCLGVCHAAPLGGSGLDAAGTGVAPSGQVYSDTTVPLSPGDIIAIAKVTIPTGPSGLTRRQLNWNRAILISTAIITVFLAMVTSYVIVRYVIVKPLRHLRDVSDSVSRGNIALRAEIHTGDEFEELAVAFNRMLRHLVTAQEELRQVNATLDGKVDELAQANMRLYEMNTVKSDFLATMSHELRTPLNSILGFSEVLDSIAALDEKQKRYVQNIQKSGRTLLEMINDILDLAKMESGKMDIRLSDFRVSQVAAAQCDMARPLTEKKNIDMETQLPADLPPMRQDQARVQQVLNNLLSNAIKFTPEGGRITVSVARDDENFLVMQVSDTGVGIAEEDQQTIFEKFRQGRTVVPSGDAMTREYSGTGLGLSIVKELCRLLGGTVSVQSVLGKGSTFTVRLPWTLQEQPRLDSSLIEGFDDFAKPRFEFVRDHAVPTAGPTAANGGTRN
jgi:signal transduction histidine kinase